MCPRGRGPPGPYRTPAVVLSAPSSADCRPPPPDVATLLLPTGEPVLPEAAFERSLAASVHC
eukprot:2934215-Prymnesium_polylepis.1